MLSARGPLAMSSSFISPKSSMLRGELPADVVRA